VTQRVDPPRPYCNPLIFVFLLKQRRFDFLKNGINPGDSMTWSKPRTRALDRAEFKNYGMDTTNAGARKYAPTTFLNLILRINVKLLKSLL